MKELSKRQREVMALTLAGHKQTVIAEALGISVRMVQIHLRIAIRKCGTVDKVSAAFFLGGQPTVRRMFVQAQLTLKL